MFKIIKIGLILVITVVTISNLSLAQSLEQSEINYFSSTSWQEVLVEDDIVDYPVIFIHGLARGPDVWVESVNTISNGDYYSMKYKESNQIFHNYHGFEKKQTFWNLSYYTENPFEEVMLGNLELYSARLEQMIDIIKSMTGQKKVVLISHSMGGLIARRYMTMSDENWDSVHKVLTIGTPHQGVDTSVGVIGQLKDLRAGSDFLLNLADKWSTMEREDEKKWGVIGAIDTEMFFNQLDDATATDSAGPGFVEIASAIPKEWSKTVGDNFTEAFYDTKRYGFRMAIDSTHIGLLKSEGTFKGIHWAISK